MEIQIKRSKIDYGNTRFGILTIFDKNDIIFNCQTIENKEKEIQKGTYILRNSYSPKFNRNLWLIDNVNEREGIRIHIGNYAMELTGCVSIGLYKDIDNLMVRSSRLAIKEFDKVLDKRILYKITIL